MLTTVANVKTGIHDNGVYIGRPTLFSNPYKIWVDGSRKDVVHKFAIYFYNRIREDPDYHEQILGLSGKTLLCHCFPKECHGDVIAGYLNSRPKPQE